jgi:uncharacterized membrane protein YozB (DUF420 family)
MAQLVPENARLPVTLWDPVAMVQQTMATQQPTRRKGSNAHWATQQPTRRINSKAYSRKVAAGQRPNPLAAWFVKGCMRRFLVHAPRRAFLLVMFLGACLIAFASLEYFDFGTLPAFVVEKLPVRFETLWLLSLRVHVAVAIVTLPSCLVLMTRSLQRRAAWHRWIGRVTGTLVVFALVPSGVVLSFDAKGGAWVTAGFLLSAAIVAAGMVLGSLAARRRELIAHRRAMLHVVAQMSVAVTSRSLIVGLDALSVDPGMAYVVALWLPVLGSALGAELVSSGIVPLYERICRAILSLIAPLRARTIARSVAGLERGVSGSMGAAPR